jgi:hypothetical protein
MVRWEGGQDKEFWVSFVNLPRVHRLRELKARRCRLTLSNPL